MNEGNITVVDVIATDDGYQLSRPAQDLYIAYEVVRRHIDSDGVRHYAQMSSAKITDNGYEFKFETGDVFTCASHEDRPASATVSDAIAGGVPAVEDADKGKYLHANESTGDLEWATAGGSGGGVLVVTDTDGTLDKTWQEIHDSVLTVLALEQSGGKSWDFVTQSYVEDDYYYLAFASGDAYKTDSASGYPTFES